MSGDIEQAIDDQQQQAARKERQGETRAHRPHPQQMGDTRPRQSGKTDDAEAAHHLRGHTRRQQQHQQAQQPDRCAKAACLLIIEREQRQRAVQQRKRERGGQRRPQQRRYRRPAILQKRARAPDHDAEQQIAIKLTNHRGDGGEYHIGKQTGENQRQRVRPARSCDQQHQQHRRNRTGKSDPKTAEQPRRRKKQRHQHQRQLRAPGDGKRTVRGERIMHGLLQRRTGERQQTTGEKRRGDFRQHRHLHRRLRQR